MSAMTDLERPLRGLPAPAAAHSMCEGCRQPIVWALTVAGPNGRGGKLMPLDPREDPAGNVAVTAPHGRLLARVLTKDEQVDRPGEYAANSHFATCPTRTKPELPPNVVDMAEQRTTRRRRRPGARP